MTTVNKGKNGVDSAADVAIAEEALAYTASKAKPRAAGAQSFQIPALDIQQFSITIVGDTPLIMHRWADKAKREIKDRQTKQAVRGKQAKNPVQDYRDSIHYYDDLGYAFPAVGLKSAAVGACRYIDGMKMTEARGAFRIVGEYVPITPTNPEQEIVPVDELDETSKWPEMREDMVRVGMGTADIRHRGMFDGWKAKFTIKYNPRVLSASQIINLFNHAGFGVGIGEWRPECNGEFGTFYVQPGDQSDE